MRGKKCEKNHPIDIKVREEEEEAFQSLEQRFPPQSLEEATVKQVFHCSLWRGPHQGRYPHGSPQSIPDYSR